jgi:glycosyltransferase involved in cell wall biosynthesis
MKVLVVVPDVAPYGGTLRFLERLLHINSRRNIVTTLLVPSDQCHDSLVSLADRYDAQLVVSKKQVRPGAFPFLTPFFDFLFCAPTALRVRPDLMVVSTGDPGRVSIALYFPIPLLYIVHSIPEKRFRFLPRCYLRFGSCLNNLIMTVSVAAASSIAETMGIARSKIEVVHNSCRIAKRGQESEIPIILTAGHVVAYKNPHLWLAVAMEVLQHTPNARFVWVGDGELLHSLRQKVEDAGMAEQILLPGFVQDLSQWYSQACIYFQPSLRESHGIAVLEAMSHGVPCVVANTGGLPESVVENETGFVCAADDIYGFADRILKLLKDEKLRQRMGMAGHCLAGRAFTEAIQEGKIINMYSQLLGRTR